VAEPEAGVPAVAVSPHVDPCRRRRSAGATDAGPGRCPLKKVFFQVVAAHWRVFFPVAAYHHGSRDGSVSDGLQETLVGEMAEETAGSQ